MGEAKKREDAAKAAAAEFNKMINTPMTQDEANEALARVDMQKAQLCAFTEGLAMALERKGA